MGSTARQTRAFRPAWDHPHIHGEHVVEKVHTQLIQGSPPYTWGAPFLTTSVKSSPGITPIYMGSTYGRPCPHGGARDHPHIHGEHHNGARRWQNHRGSPPYTWGALYDKSTVNIKHGITPIYMGSTLARLPHLRRCRDHPHIHGEHHSKD